MTVLGQSMQLAAANLEAITPGLVFIFAGVAILAFLILYDAIHHD